VQSADIVEDLDSCLERRLRDFILRCINGDRYFHSACDLLDDRQDAAHLFFDGDGFGAWPGRFAADV